MFDNFLITHNTQVLIPKIIKRHKRKSGKHSTINILRDLQKPNWFNSMQNSLYIRRLKQKVVYHYLLCLGESIIRGTTSKQEKHFEIDLEKRYKHLTKTQNAESQCNLSK